MKKLSRRQFVEKSIVAGAGIIAAPAILKSASPNETLGAMIDRAGYPTIANGVDETLIQAVLPRMEERAFAIVGEHASDGGK